MRVELTQSSAAERKKLIFGKMTPEVAARYLRSGEISLRSFAVTLKLLYPGDDLSERLIREFTDGEKDVNKSSVVRRIRNWLSGQNTPTQREDIFRIAFALHLSEEQTSQLLGFCTDYGIHYRNGHDVVYAWFLRNGRSYREAKAFFESLPPVPQLQEAPSKSSPSLTREVENAFLRPTTPDELRQAYLQNLNRFGSLHLRAYWYFCGYLDKLVHPSAAWGSDEEPTYSLETVMNLYLSLKIPQGKKRSQYNIVQKLIRRDWPNATALKNIRSRKEDVPRKLILLLYVITENLSAEDCSPNYPEYMTLEERLDDHWLVLNSILNDCGMPPLDLHNPTDWLVLYAITADEDEPMSERMAQVIDELFEKK